jgi:ATP-dependent DNA ligase
MLLPTLFKRTNTGAIQEWTIEIEGNKFRTLAGQFGGKLVVSQFTECLGKNTGKKNETTPETQAFAEASAKWKKKTEKGYYETIAEIDGDHFKSPMLAKDYTEFKSSINFPVWSDRKYNGMRIIATAKGLFTRNGKVILSAPHISAGLAPLFNKYPNLVLDGEGYSHTLRHKLNQIISLLRKITPTEEELIKSTDIVEYHVYDGYGFEEISTKTKFSDRKIGIKTLLTGIDKVVCVESELARNQEDLDKLYTKYLAEEFEGQMIRVDGPYEHKRSTHLLKRKEFKDAEFIIKDLIEGEGNRTNTVGAVICELPNGDTFKSNIKGDFEYISNLWKERLDCIGKTATIKFFDYSEYGVPLFPYVIAIDRFDT